MKGEMIISLDIEVNEIMNRLVKLANTADSEPLELLLIKTLFTLIGSGDICIYIPNDIDNLRFTLTSIDESLNEANLSDQWQTKLRHCLEFNSSLRVLNDNNETVILYPLYNAKNTPNAIVAILMHEKRTYLPELSEKLIHIYKNFTKLMNEYELDTLTGLYNRMTLEIKIKKIISKLQSIQSRRGEDSCDAYYLAMFDIDHFKNVNDNFGHLVGDEVLMEFARMLTTNFREKDLLFRFGGEEFVGIFQCRNASDMEKIMNNFRSKVENTIFNKAGNLTISNGFTEILSFDSASNIIGRADAALYFAKNNGRNRVCFYESLLASEGIESIQMEGSIDSSSLSFF